MVGKTKFAAGRSHGSPRKSYVSFLATRKRSIMASSEVTLAQYQSLFESLLEQSEIKEGVPVVQVKYEQLLLKLPQGFFGVADALLDKKQRKSLLKDMVAKLSSEGLISSELGKHQRVVIIKACPEKAKKVFPLLAGELEADNGMTGSYEAASLLLNFSGFLRGKGCVKSTAGSLFSTSSGNNSAA